MAPASNDFDLHSFIEQQSSDDDVSYLQGLNRSLEDILNDSEVESYSERFDDETAKPFLFRNPSFTRQRREKDENNADWAEKGSRKLEKVKGHSSSFSITDRLKIGFEKGMQALVEHYSKKGWLRWIEQCVLDMDIGSLDFNQVVRLCREHGLYNALIYLFNRGLDDFKAPLEELLAVAQD